MVHVVWRSIVTAFPSFILWFAAGANVHAAAVSGSPADPYLRPAVAPAPADNLLTPARVDLGKILFFDPRLSGSNWISCATCHNPGLGWSDGLAKSVGHGMKPLRRGAPSILNVAFNPIQMWDGRSPNFEMQALIPIETPDIMAQDMPGLISKLGQIEGYRVAFEKAYAGEGISGTTIVKALASYQRTVLSTESPFDRWRKGNQQAMSASAKRGFALFEGKAQCAKCHSGFNFTDNGFHNIGLEIVSDDDDPGRFGQRKVAIAKGAFKTPSLRDVALTAPYMHHGIYKTLEAVVEHYDRGGVVKDNVSPNIVPLNLSAQEKTDLVAFMKSLTGTPARVVFPQLPQ
jgi:cytochrome c peroxidase